MIRSTSLAASATPPAMDPMRIAPRTSGIPVSRSAMAARARCWRTGSPTTGTAVPLSKKLGLGPPALDHRSAALRHLVGVDAASVQARVRLRLHRVRLASGAQRSLVVGAED